MYHCFGLQALLLQSHILCVVVSQLCLDVITKAGDACKKVNQVNWLDGNSTIIMPYT